MVKFKKVAILGVGLIGGSLALELKKKKIASSVWGSFRSRKKILRAKARKIVDKGSMDVEEVIQGADLIVLGLPVRKNLEYLKKIKPYLKPDQIVIDVGSTKKEIVNFARQTLKGKYEFVGCHPIAGSEKRGFDNACSGLFEGTVCVVCKDSPSGKKTMGKIRKMWERLGCKVVFISSKEHDRILALTSHLPHVLSYTLSYTIPGGLQLLSAGGLKSMLRISNSYYPLWEEIFLSNKSNVLSSIKKFEKNLKKVSSSLKKEDYRTLRRILRIAFEKSCANPAGNSKP